MEDPQRKSDALAEAEADLPSDAEGGAHQPGLGELREAVANRPDDERPRRSSWVRDGLAGLSGAISNVPDGMANGLIDGPNPVLRLYASMVGPAVGGALSHPVHADRPHGGCLNLDQPGTR